jgi:hypothetical protein
MDLHHFELTLKPTILRKAIRLYQGGLVEHEGPVSLSRVFYVRGEKVEITISNGTVGRWNCSCGKKPYCEHFAAALFLVQKRRKKLDIPQPVSSSPGKGVDQLYKKVAEALSFSNPDQALEKIRVGIRKADPPLTLSHFYFAVIKAVSTLPLMAATERNAVLDHWLSRAFGFLRKKKILPEECKDAGFGILRKGDAGTAHKLTCYRGVMSLMVTRFNNPHTHSILSHIVRTTVKKFSQVSGPDWPTVFLKEMSLLEAGVQWRRNNLFDDLESAMAHCELRSSFNTKVSALIGSYLKGSVSANIYFLRYALDKALAAGDAELIAACAGRLIVREPFLNDQLWNCFYLNTRDKITDAGDLIEKLSGVRGPEVEEKIARILAYTNRKEELRKFLSRSVVRFSLVHELAMRSIDPGMTKVYVHRFWDAVSDPKQASLRPINMRRAEEYMKKLDGDYSLEKVIAKAKECFSGIEAQ